MTASHLVGIFPRSEALIEATRALDRGRVGPEEVERALAEATAAIVSVQVEAGLGYVLDGMLRWQDLLRPFSDGIPGMLPGPLTRWFDNNTFYRRPVVRGRLEPTGRAVLPLVARQALAGRRWMAVLPSPFALLALSEGHAYGDRDELLRDLAAVIRAEAQALASAGAAYLQFNDPALVARPEQVGRARAAMEIATDGLAIRTALHTYFGDPAAVLPELLRFPVDEVGLDLYAADLRSLRGDARGKVVLAGVIDGRNSLLEDPRAAAETARRLAEAVRADDVAVVPSCDLEFLPWSVAMEKTRRLGETARILAGQ